MIPFVTGLTKSKTETATDSVAVRKGNVLPIEIVQHRALSRPA